VSAAALGPTGPFCGPQRHVRAEISYLFDTLGSDRHRLCCCFRRDRRCKQGGPTASRLIQAAFIYVSIAIPLVYCKVKKIALKDILLTGIDREGVKTCLYYLPLIAVLLPMIVSGVDVSDTGYVLVTLLFTLGVGIAEELYFRGIILRLLGKSFGPLPVVFISMLIFGIGHASGAFVESSLVMVLLAILNAFLFGWIAAETALITKNILPLMVFHCLFDFFTYQMLATGDAMVMVYAVRGTLMTIVAVYLLIKLQQQSGNKRVGSAQPAWGHR
jgi:membrane protease YdiL (CAAX protease family)